QLPSGNVGGFFDNFYVRTEAMPALTSYPLSGVLQDTELAAIVSLTSGGFVVGADANNTGRTYRGFCWRGDTDYGEVLHWTGTGNGFGPGCANEANRQNVQVIAGGAVQFVMAAGCTQELPSGCDGSTCELHLGAQGGWRGTNIGNTVVGPGHIAG